MIASGRRMEQRNDSCRERDMIAAGRRMEQRNDSCRERDGIEK